MSDPKDKTKKDSNTPAKKDYATLLQQRDDNAQVIAQNKEIIQNLKIQLDAMKAESLNNKQEHKTP